MEEVRCFMRKLFLLIALAASFVLGSGGRAEAGILSSFIDTGYNRFQDNSVAVSLCGGLPVADGSLEVGDIFVGFIRFDQRLEPSNINVETYEQLVLFFAAEVVDVTPASVEGVYKLGAVTQDGFRVQDFLSFEGPGFFSDETVFAVYSDGNNTSNPTAGTLAAGLAEIEDTYKFGFSGGIVNPMTDFFEVRIDENPADTGQGDPIGNERGMFSVIRQDGLPLVEFTGAPGLSPFSSLGNPVASDIRLFGELFKATTSQNINGWTFGDQAIADFNAVVIPEPGSMLVWAGLLGFAAFAFRRRMNNNV
jgi:hypothetical protein